MPAPNAPRLGPEGATCTACGAPLATDQRYCLQCGQRRGEARLPFQALLEPPAPSPPPPPPAPRAQRRPVWAVAVAAAGLVGLGAGAGALLAGGDRPPPTAAAPPVVNITNAIPTAAAAATADATAQPEQVSTTWPAGTEGWTISLRRIPKDASPQEVQTAIADATTAGASDVGVLDEDEFASLQGGSYLVYSGVHDTRRAARDALRAVEDAFPDATVVRVTATADETSGGDTLSDEELKDAEKLSPAEAQEKIRKAPNEVESEGEKPPVDDKAPTEGAEEGTEIG